MSLLIHQTDNISGKRVGMEGSMSFIMDIEVNKKKFKFDEWQIIPEFHSKVKQHI